MKRKQLLFERPHMCGCCPVINGDEVSSKRDIKCKIDDTVKINNFKDPPPETCPLLTHSIELRVYGDMIYVHKKALED